MSDHDVSSICNRLDLLDNKLEMLNMKWEQQDSRIDKVENCINEYRVLREQENKLRHEFMVESDKKFHKRLAILAIIVTIATSIVSIIIKFI